LNDRPKRRSIAVRAGTIAFAGLLVAGVLAGAFAQEFRGIIPNVKYDGRFQLVRLRYDEFRGRSEGWKYDYPWMESHLMTMFDELTKVKIARKGSNILTMDDPELLNWPVAYLSEPGYWYPSTDEVKGLREYLTKGGFLIVDDFFVASGGFEWPVFERAMLSVLPDAKIMRLDEKNPIYDAFYRIKTLDDLPYPDRPSLKAEFYGIYEGNDPKKRLMVVINYNTDLGEYMQFSDMGRWPVNLSNNAYKFAMNYIIYGLVF
jgi:hypothetical protein